MLTPVIICIILSPSFNPLSLFFIWVYMRVAFAVLKTHILKMSLKEDECKVTNVFLFGSHDRSDSWCLNQNWMFPFGKRFIFWKATSFSISLLGMYQRLEHKDENRMYWETQNTKILPAQKETFFFHYCHVWLKFWISVRCRLKLPLIRNKWSHSTTEWWQVVLINGHSEQSSGRSI